MKSEKVFVFDVGGVILLCNHLIACKKLATMCGRTPSGVYGLIFTRGLEKLYDEGRISSKDFYKRCLKILGIRISFKDFSRIWSDVYKENKMVSRFVRRLSRIGHRVYLLSNTNELHYRFIKRKFRIISEVDGRILSFRVGHRKPSRQIYRALLSKTGKPVANHIYIDDRREFVRAARSLGIPGIVFESFTQLKKEL